MSLLWLCNSPAAGLDSTRSPSGRQASPNIRPFGAPSRSVPIWQPATPGSMPSESFHHVILPSVQSRGLKSNVPAAPAIPCAPGDGSWSEFSEQACSAEIMNISDSIRIMFSSSLVCILRRHWVQGVPKPPRQYGRFFSSSACPGLANGAVIRSPGMTLPVVCSQRQTTKRRKTSRTSGESLDAGAGSRINRRKSKLPHSRSKRPSFCLRHLDGRF